MKVELLYFDGCPSWQSALANLESALAGIKMGVQIHLIEIGSIEQAIKERFLGSPSIRVDSVDLWPEKREEYSLACRVYQTPEGFRGWPTIEMIQKRITELLHSNNIGAII